MQAFSPKIAPSTQPELPSDQDAPAKLSSLVRTILDRLDAADDERCRNRRTAARIPFRRESVPIVVTHPGGSISERVVATRNLSASGIGFLYDSFLHKGTRVVVKLTQVLGGTDELTGTVAFCAHVSGVFHQVGIKFYKKVFANLYLGESLAELRSAVSTSPDLSDAEVSAMSGGLLMVDASAPDRSLVARYLGETKVRMVTVENFAGAIVALATPSTRFDAVLIEANFQSADAGLTLQAIRAVGHEGPIIVAVAARVDAKTKAKGQSIGATAVIAKPYDRAELLTTLRSLMVEGSIVIQDTAAA